MSRRASRQRPSESEERGAFQESRERWKRLDRQREDRERSLEPLTLRRRECESSVQPMQRRPRSTSPLRFSNSEQEWLRENTSIVKEIIHSRVVEQEKRRERVTCPSLPQNEIRDVETRPRLTHTIEVRCKENVEQAPGLVMPQIRESWHILQAPSSPTASALPAPAPHQEIVVHHRHLDQGFDSARTKVHTLPQAQETHIDIDFYSPRQKSSHNESPRENVRVQIDHKNPKSMTDDALIYDSDRKKLRFEDAVVNSKRSQSLSIRVRNPREDTSSKPTPVNDDEESLARKTNERAYMGEAWNGATKDWAIVDVPPGTERVRFDGIGGGSQEITWQKYSGVRRSKFTPNQELNESREPASKRRQISFGEPLEKSSDRDSPKSSGFEIQVRSSPDHPKEETYVCKRNYFSEERGTDERIDYPRKYSLRAEDVWTEITKDLVIRQALVEMGYEFEETKYFYYIFQYLQYEDVLELVKLSYEIRRERQRRVREIEWERTHDEVREREHY